MALNTQTAWPFLHEKPSTSLQRDGDREHPENGECEEDPGKKRECARGRGSPISISDPTRVPGLPQVEHIQNRPKAERGHHPQTLRQSLWSERRELLPSCEDKTKTTRSTFPGGFEKKPDSRHRNTQDIQNRTRPHARNQENQTRCQGKMISRRGPRGGSEMGLSCPVKQLLEPRSLREEGASTPKRNDKSYRQRLKKKRGGEHLGGSAG